MLVFVPIVFAGAGLYAASRLVRDKYWRIVPLAAIFALVYAWLAMVSSLSPIEVTGFISRLLPAFFVSSVALYLLERQDEVLAGWLLTYTATIFVFIVFL